MNWFVSQQLSADSMVQAGLPFLEVFCAFAGAVALLMLLAAVLHTILEVRSSGDQVGEAKLRAHRLSSQGRRKQIAHRQGWILTR